MRTKGSCLNRRGRRHYYISSPNLIGSLPYYVIYYDWKIFTERLEQYFIANQIEVNNYVPILLTTISEDVYSTIRQLSNPKLPKDLEYNERIDIMQKYVDCQHSMYKERVKFHRAEQEENETIIEWVERIRILSKNCRFIVGYDLDIYLLDKFISGLRSDVLLDRLCMERPGDLTLTRAIEIATTNPIEK